MKIVGIIAEYNPFHNGHLYHIKQALEVTQSDVAVVIMSGDFVQRGAPAILSKHIRTRAALCAGASVVLELPACYACGSAEYFAMGAISIFNKLSCIDAICFGSECGDITQLDTVAQILADEPSEYRQFLQNGLRQGLSFPTARQQALEQYTGSAKVSQLLASPNNILGVEYLKALHRTNSSITPYTITRNGADYHETDLTDHYSSASAIREFLSTNGCHDLAPLKEHLPESMYELLKTRTEPLYANDFSLLFRYKLLAETRDTLCTYADVSEDLANRLWNSRNQFSSWTQFCDLLKTKDLTYSRISRAMLHILLDIKAADLAQYQANDYGFYARVLGFRKADTDVLKLFKEHSTIPVITKLGNCDALSQLGNRMLETDCFASNLYEIVRSNKYGSMFTEEHSKSLELLK